MIPIDLTCVIIACMLMHTSCIINLDFLLDALIQFWLELHSGGRDFFYGLVSWYLYGYIGLEWSRCERWHMIFFRSHLVYATYQFTCFHNGKCVYRYRAIQIEYVLIKNANLNSLELCVFSIVCGLNWENSYSLWIDTRWHFN